MCVYVCFYVCIYACVFMCVGVCLCMYMCDAGFICVYYVLCVLTAEENAKSSEFWDVLGGYVDPESLPAGPEDSDELPLKMPRKLFKISNASGSMEVIEVATIAGQLKRNMLNTDDVFIVQGTSKLFIWVGESKEHKDRRQLRRVLTRECRP